jgi:dihydrofolate reductase
MKRVSLVVAHDLDWHIGNSTSNSIPWHIPADLKYFRELTLHKPVIMGSNTFLSLGKPLDARLNIVITRSPDKIFPFVNGHLSYGYDRIPVVTVDTLAKAISVAHSVNDEAVVIGGGIIYERALADGLVDIVYETVVHIQSAGDITFPILSTEEPNQYGVWEKRIEYGPYEHKGMKYSINQLYKKRA